MAKHAVSSLTLAILLAAPAARAVEPHRSEATLPSSNGMAAIAYDATEFKLTQFLEHPYAYPDASTQTRNFAYDSYPGLRVGSTGTWLDTVAPVVIEYVPGTAVVHAQHFMTGMTVDEYHFAPLGLAEYASVMLVEVTQTTASAAVDAYSLFNYHLGSGSPAPGTDSELITYDATRDAYYESGPSGVTIGYTSLVPSSFHGCTPNNPFDMLNAGSNLMNDPGTGGATTDAVPGFQQSLGTLAVGSTGWAGWVTVLAPDANAAPRVDAVRAWVAGRTPSQLLAAEVAAWSAWVTPAPAGASALEASAEAQAQVTLKMGQVTEPGAPNGQILASVAPGAWNITWVRDMAYATVALVQTGHLDEAKAALAFQMSASSGTFQQYVGAPYQISVVRYFGDGTEQSDSNANGPNIEFDGFGLFLWALDTYVEASNDTATLASWWPVVGAKVGDVLVQLQEPTGLISADSSIWEVHWDGQQRHFAYTTIAAANGLCAASRLATKAGDATRSATYLAAGQKARDSLLPNLRGADGTLAQSTEGLAAGSGWLDAAVVESINFGLIDPMKRTARATLASMQSGLVPQSGRGFMRSDAGDSYSSNEWVFVDLRAERSLELHGDTTYSVSLFAWNVDQAAENFGEFSELHDPVTADYAGQSPMVGFGAGAYALSLSARGTPVVPTCGAFASEPADPVDAGPEGGADDAGGDASQASGDGGNAPGTDGGPASTNDGGAANGDFGGSSSGCASAPGGSGGWSVAFAAFTLWLAGRRRKR
jgi:hypothetical protein